MRARVVYIPLFPSPWVRGGGDWGDEIRTKKLSEKKLKAKKKKVFPMPKYLSPDRSDA